VPEYRPPSEAQIRGGNVVSLSDHERLSRDRARRILEPAAQRVQAAGLACDTKYAESDHPYRAIIETAEGCGCDLILMSSHGRSGLSALWHGSQTRDVLTHSRIPTLVYR
jgi:nucleotide-binding universal stress UspA family protein